MPNEKTLIRTEYREMNHLDYLLILYIRQLREERGWTQQELSERMGVTKSFVGNVESFTQRHKYSIRHLTLIAKAFEYNSISKLFDFPTPEHDKIRLILKVTTVLKENEKSRSKSVEVVKIVEGGAKVKSNKF
ncbi:helix-turn-helix domain-containing protein [Galbibacter sp.]|uniref:helix-turn-helix domain-containing protein n=1 Tax=Galbibacter sp. TaxID=2918471 RepID=UPI003A8DDC28